LVALAIFIFADGVMIFTSHFRWVVTCRKHWAAMAERMTRLSKAKRWVADVMILGWLFHFAPLKA
jgi:hypothetical protein